MTAVVQCPKCGMAICVADKAQWDSESCPSCAKRAVELPTVKSETKSSKNIELVGSENLPLDDEVTIGSVLRMVAMAPVACLAAAIAAFLTFLLFGTIYQVLAWITAGITQVTGRVFVFQIILVIALIVLIPTAFLFTWAVCGTVASTLIVKAGLGFRENIEPARNRRAIGLLIASPLSGLAFLLADWAMWSLITGMMLAGTSPLEPMKARFNQIVAEEQFERDKAVSPDPTKSFRRSQERKRSKRICA